MVTASSFLFAMPFAFSTFATLISQKSDRDLMRDNALVKKSGILMELAKVDNLVTGGCGILT